MKISAFLCILAGFFSTYWSYAQVAGSNPVVRDRFTADPAALVHNDRVYLYTGHDEATESGTWFRMRDWRVYSSADMVNWTDHGSCLSTTQFSWASGDAWASHCVYKNGKFYWYVSVSHRTIGGKAIGVAVSDSPTGPFRDARGSAIITTDMTPGKGDFDDIDPAVFIDDDGQAYLYWGNGACRYVKLNADMTSFSGPVVSVDVPRFGEAPWIHKRNGVYYLSYSSSLPSTIEYATSSSPTGPWTYRGRIADVVENCQTSHQAIIEFRNQWYFVYHNGVLPTGGNHRRSVCIDYMCYNQDGTIKKVLQTKTGMSVLSPCPPAVAVRTPFKGEPHKVPGRIEAEEYDIGGEGVAYHEADNNGNQGGAGNRNDQVDIEVTADTSGSYNIAYIMEGEWLEYTVDVAETGVYTVGFRMAANRDASKLHMKVDGIDVSGPVTVPNTGGWQNWRTVFVKNIPMEKGKRIVRISFDDSYMNFNYMTFSLNERPVVRIVNPVKDVLVNAFQPISIEAVAEDADGEVKSVILYEGSSVLEEYRDPPYMHVWTGAQPGIYAITAKAVDDQGEVSTSEVVRLLVKAPFNEYRHSVPGRIEAEEYDLGGEGVGYHEANSNGNQGGAGFRDDEVDIEVTGDLDGQYNIAYIMAGEWLQYTVEVLSSGVYDLNLRMAADGAGKTLHIEIDGVNMTQQPIAVPNTGGWQNWQTVTVPDVRLTAGEHVMRIVFGASYMNLNYVEFVDVITGMSTRADIQANGFPNPFSADGMMIRYSGDFTYRITDISGKLVETGSGTNQVMVGATLYKGTYFLQLEGNNKPTVHKIVKY